MYIEIFVFVWLVVLLSGSAWDKWWYVNIEVEYVYVLIFVV